MNILPNKKVLIVTGPTGIGKTDFVLRLAAGLPSEIINADIGQMYTPLTIGTAKPDWQNEPVPHHLFDIIDTPRDFSVMQFRKHVTQLVQEIWDRNRTPIIVGGSTLYIKSLFFKPVSHVLLDQQEIQKIQAPITSSKQDLWHALNEIDPKRAANIHPNDNYRLARALEIWCTTGILPSHCVPQYAPIAKNMQIFVLNSSKKELYDKIDQRVHVMMEMGWLDEVRKLPVAWHDFLRTKKIIGYELILDYLASKDEGELDTCIKLIQQRVRNYAKRQQTFWRSLKRELETQIDADNVRKNFFELDITLLDVNLYIKQLLLGFKGD